MPTISGRKSVPVWSTRLSDLRRQFMAATNYLGSMFTLGVAFLCHSIGFVVLARNLPSADIGKLAMLSAVSTLGAAWCEAGACEMARRRVGRDASEYARVLGHALILIFGVGSLISILLIILCSYFIELGSNFYESAKTAALIIPANICLFVFVSFAEQLVNGKGDLTRANLIVTGSGLARAVVSIVACFGFGVSSLTQWAPFHLLFYAISGAGAVVAIWPYGPPKATILREELPRGATMSAWSSLYMLRQNVDFFVLSAVATPELIGNYSVARRVLGAASTVGAGFDRVAYSRLVVAGRAGVRAAANQAKFFARYLFPILALSTIGIYFAADFIPFVFGAKYAEAKGMAQMLCIIIIAQGFQNLAFDTLNACEQHYVRLLMSILSAIIGSSLIAALAWMGGMDGALIGIICAECVTSITLWGTLTWLSHRRT